ncbi:MAG: hypothetical protein AAF221_09280 [Pseudomonadota bacterium]
MSCSDMPSDLWTQGYRPISAKIFLRPENERKSKSPLRLEEFDLAPDYPVLRAILRNWLANGNPPIDHVEVVPREDVDRDTLAANSISCLVH